VFLFIFSLTFFVKRFSSSPYIGLAVAVLFMGESLFRGGDAAEF
jgi:hypothetical protein